MQKGIAEETIADAAFALGVLLGALAGLLGWIRLVHIWRDKA